MCYNVRVLNNSKPLKRRSNCHGRNPESASQLRDAHERSDSKWTAKGLPEPENTFVWMDSRSMEDVIPRQRSRMCFASVKSIGFSITDKIRWHRRFEIRSVLMSVKNHKGRFFIFNALLLTIAQRQQNAKITPVQKGTFQ